MAVVVLHCGVISFELARRGVPHVAAGDSDSGDVQRVCVL